MDGICRIHGMQHTIHTSKDIIKKIYDDNYRFMPVIVFFEYDREVVEVFYLSCDFAEKYGLKNNQRLPLPDDYPPWVLDLAPACNECLKKRLIQDDFSIRKN